MPSGRARACGPARCDTDNSAACGLRPADLDETDRTLVRILQADGRTPVAELARTVGLSHAATRQRLNRLIQERIVAVGTMTHPGTHGLHRSAIVGIRCDSRTRSVAENVSKLDEAYYVVTGMGAYDLIVEVMARDDAHLIDLVASIRSITGVLSTDVTMIAETTKWVYAPDFTG
ncbi:Lrp/AsnC family transcriptional regulator [Streptomyces niveus]|uniref:AsnC family transcriptional regulator n=1 Tax=Streptomyces niveus TaxID=193462 RepID=A0ABZ1ZVR9_STRNV|nr:AsnC family transcriptional regulator [Streptomyces niveus]